MWKTCVSVCDVCVRERSCLSGARVCVPENCTRICTGFCVLQQKIHTGVIQNRNYVPCYGCSSVIFPLIKRSTQDTRLSFQHQPMKQRGDGECASECFYTLFFGLATRRHSAYLRSFFHPFGLFTAQNGWSLFFLLLSTSLSPGETAQIFCS